MSDRLYDPHPSDQGYQQGGNSQTARVQDVSIIVIWIV
jgi:hypothetical protein